MSDVIDRAQDLQALQLRASLSHVEHWEQGMGAAHCRDCNETIPKARRALGANIARCVYCQEAHERTQQ